MSHKGDKAASPIAFLEEFGLDQKGWKFSKNRRAQGSRGPAEEVYMDAEGHEYRGREAVVRWDCDFEPPKRHTAQPKAAKASAPSASRAASTVDALQQDGHDEATKSHHQLHDAMRSGQGQDGTARTPSGTHAHAPGALINASLSQPTHLQTIMTVLKTSPAGLTSHDLASAAGLEIAAVIARLQQDSDQFLRLPHPNGYHTFIYTMRHARSLLHRHHTVLPASIDRHFQMSEADDPTLLNSHLNPNKAMQGQLHTICMPAEGLPAAQKQRIMQAAAQQLEDRPVDEAAKAAAEAQQPLHTVQRARVVQLGMPNQAAGQRPCHPKGLPLP
ncbi:hypothetical protein WJX74_009884 [Apatococcus lobatus]|uniref:Uncharacterized protein n=1 Tax=Apatococcus lobatus TaxID=904363 RepID=A0AAW1QL36_9CHLO